MFEHIRRFQEEFKNKHGVEPRVEIKIHEATREFAEVVSVRAFLDGQLNGGNFQLPQHRQGLTYRWITTESRQHPIDMTIFYQEDGNEKTTADNNNSDDAYGDFSGDRSEYVREGV